MCFRDSSGHLLYGKSSYVQSSTTVLEAETIALLSSLNVTTLLEVVASPNVLTNEFNDPVSCCRCLLVSNPDFVVSFIKKQVTKIVCNITRASLSSTNLHIFYDVSPAM